MLAQGKCLLRSTNIFSLYPLQIPSHDQNVEVLLPLNVLFCNILYCIVLYCTVLQFIVLYCIVPYRIALYELYALLILSVTNNINDTYLTLKSSKLLGRPRISLPLHLFAVK